MTHSFHIAAPTPSPKRDADLRACERHGALRLRNLRDYGATTID